VAKEIFEVFRHFFRDYMSEFGFHCGIKGYGILVLKIISICFEKMKRKKKGFALRVGCLPAPAAASVSVGVVALIALIWVCWRNVRLSRLGCGVGWRRVLVGVVGLVAVPSEAASEPAPEAFAGRRGVRRVRVGVSVCLVIGVVYVASVSHSDDGEGQSGCGRQYYDDC
jgi:hypothetical protein